MTRTYNKAVLYLAMFFLILSATALGTDPNAPGDYIDVRIQNISKADINRLSFSGISITTVHGATAEANVRAEQVKDLVDMGFDVEIIPKTHRKASLYEGYPTYQELTAELERIADDYPEICRLESIGTSNNGYELWFMKISDNVDIEEDEPEFKYISTMHGDEPVGTVLMVDLINYLVNGYGTVVTATELVDNVEIWIMPLMNPDGYVSGQRNAYGGDLNRKFPDRIDDPVNTTDGRPIEVQHVMNWAFDHSSVLSANFHTGALVANYPYDCYTPPASSGISPTPDHELFIDLALAYSSLNQPMFDSPWFDDGIINGADWYVIRGGMQDWNYVWMGCMELTIELYDIKAPNDPNGTLLDGLWGDNRNSMLAYMEWCLKGVRGIITDTRTGLPLSAIIEIQGIDYKVYTDPDVGDYHRILLPGTYTLNVSAPGHQDAIIENVNVVTGTAVRLDIGMDASAGNFNCDDAIDVADAIIALQIVCGITHADAACLDAWAILDNKIGIRDAIYCLQSAADLN